MACEGHGDQRALAVHERIRNEGTTEKRRGPRRCQPTRLLQAHVAEQQLMLRFSSAAGILFLQVPAPQETYTRQPAFSKQKLRRVKETGQGC